MNKTTQLEITALRAQRERSIRSTPTVMLAGFAKKLRYQRGASEMFHDLFMEELTRRARNAMEEVGHE